MSGQTRTSESIRDALGNSALAQRCLAEIDRTPAHELIGISARWERMAKDTVAAVEWGQGLAPGILRRRPHRRLAGRHRSGASRR